MAWIVGIDEAGYGPNLGPFVMSMAAVRVPGALLDANIWKLLSKAVSRRCESKNGKLWVNDSKLIYSSEEGLPRLERHYLPFQWRAEHDCWPLETYWSHTCLTPFEDLQREPWHSTDSPLPLCQPAASLQAARGRLMRACLSCEIEFAPVKSVVIFPRQFNGLVKQHGSKGAIPAHAINHLLKMLPAPDEDGTTWVCIDKLGGRNHYHELLQRTYTDRMVMVRLESSRDSRYQLVCSSERCEFSFQPKADRRFFAVALASMASKYLREVLMTQFNNFWQQHISNLKPTAGYPSDSARFYEDIRFARKRLGIPDEVLWRER